MKRDTVIEIVVVVGVALIFYHILDFGLWSLLIAILAGATLRTIQQGKK